MSTDYSNKQNYWDSVSFLTSLMYKTLAFLVEIIITGFNILANIDKSPFGICVMAIILHLVEKRVHLG